MRAAARYLFVAIYCLVIFAILDFAYSSLFFSDDARRLHIADPVYHHGLTPNYDGFDIWGERRVSVQTNNLGMKDFAVRDVPLKTDARRILLIGDSFTEAQGVAFPDSFAGRLYQAGQQRTPKIEFLNAGVASYSPTIYYVKVKHLLDLGLKIDEVVVFPDMSDIQDESRAYFCIDPIPEYRALCVGDGYDTIDKTGWSAWLRKKFIVTDNTRALIKFKLRQSSGAGAVHSLAHSNLDGWALTGWDDSAWAPLRIKDAMARATRQMQALADLLKARGIALSVGVYPHPAIVNAGKADNLHVDLWRGFCAANCKQFIDLFPAVMAYASAHPADWYSRLYIYGDIHFTEEGNRVLYEELAPRVLK